MKKIKQWLPANNLPGYTTIGHTIYLATPLDSNVSHTIYN